MQISHQAVDADISLVRFDGRLDASSSPDVRAALQTALEKERPKVIVDLQDVPFIDSSGLAALVSGLRLAREKEGDIVLCGVQAQAQGVFRLTMLDHIFTIQPTSEEARQSLA